MKSALTERTLQTLSYSGKPTTIWDASLKGFGVRIMKNRKTFTVMRGKRRERLTIGHYPAISLQEARKQARVLLATKALTNAPRPILEALDEFLDTHCKPLKGGRQMEWNLNAHVTPISLHRVDRQYVQTILDELKDTPSEANHFFQYFRTFMMWCVRRGYLETYPLTAMVMPHKRPSRERVLTDKELSAIWNACGTDTFSVTVKLLIITGQRRGEIQHLILDGDAAVLPGTHSKNGKEHRFPIGPLAQELLKTNRTFNGWSKAKAQLDQRVNNHFKDTPKMVPWTLHDLRRTYATKHAQLKTPIHVIEKLLNHVSGSLAGVAGIYNRYNYQSEMRQAVDSYDEHIAFCMTPQPI